MRGIFAAPTIAAGLICLSPAGAQATVQVAVDLTHQRMHVASAQGSYDWPISSAAAGYITPPGTYAVQHLERMHYSRLYHMSPMPYSIFFAGGYAIHGTYATGALGRPASHGCVRLAPGHAATLFAMVQREGASISIAGSPPPSQRLYEARRHSRPGGYADADDGSPAYARARPAAYGGYGYGYGGYGYGAQPPGYGYGYGSSPF